MRFVLISEPSAFISLHSVNWSCCYKRDDACLLRGTDWYFKYSGL